MGTKWALALGLLTCIPTALEAKQKASPEELGAINSPAAFLDVCSARALLEQEKKKHQASSLGDQEASPNAKGSDASFSDAEIELIIVGTSDAICEAVIRSVAETILATPDYRIDGRKVCFDPTTTRVTDVVAAAKKVHAAGGPPTELSTPLFVLYVLHQEFSC
jgi:hypothetical protein